AAGEVHHAAGAEIDGAVGVLLVGDVEALDGEQPADVHVGLDLHALAAVEGQRAGVGVDDQGALDDRRPALDLVGQLQHDAARQLQLPHRAVVHDGQAVRRDGDAEQGEAAVDGQVQAGEVPVVDHDAGAVLVAQRAVEVDELRLDGHLPEDGDVLHGRPILDGQVRGLERDPQQADVGGHRG